MIAGSDYLEINHQQDCVTVTIRENGVTATAHLPITKMFDAQQKLTEHINAAVNWRPPGLIEYTGANDRITE